MNIFSFIITSALQLLSLLIFIYCSYFILCIILPQSLIDPLFPHFAIHFHVTTSLLFQFVHAYTQTGVSQTHPFASTLFTKLSFFAFWASHHTRCAHRYAFKSM